jgi:hypothetical protein
MIFIDKIVQPERGAVILAHCSFCKKFTITVSEDAVKPENGDLRKMEFCFEIPAHNFLNEISN